MNRTGNFRPKVPSRLSITDDTDSKENKRPTAPAAGAGSSKRRERDTSNPAGKHSELAKETAENRYIDRTAKALMAGTQPAKVLLDDKVGLNSMKDDMFLAGYVLKHETKKNTLAAVPASRYLDPELVSRATAKAKARGRQQPLTPERIVEEIAKNAQLLSDGLQEVVKRSKSRAPLSPDEAKFTDNAVLVLRHLVQKPATYAKEVSRNPALRDKIVDAAHQIGVQLIYVPGYATPVPVERYDMVAHMPDE